MVVAAVLLLLVAPTLVRGILERAGIRAVAGIEFDLDDMADSQLALEAAQNELNQIREQLLVAQRAIEPDQNATGARSIDPRNRDVSRLLDEIAANAEKAAQDVQESKEKQNVAIEAAVKTQQLKSPEELFDRARLRRALRPDVSQLSPSPILKGRLQADAESLPDGWVR